MTRSSPVVFSPRDASMGSAGAMSITTPLTSPGPVQEESWNILTIRKELRHAAQVLGHYNLKLSAKWACEQLIGLPPPSSSNNVVEMTSETPTSWLNKEDDVCLYAKSLMDLGEYAHAAAELSQASKEIGTFSPPLPHLSSFGIFLRAYSIYLGGERRKEQELVELKDPLERTSVRNEYLSQLCEELQEFYENDKLDALGTYVFGLVLREAQQSKVAASKYKAHVILMKSILAFPWNWSAWLDLASECLQDAQLHTVVEETLSSLANHYMYHYFCAHVFGENQAQENGIQVMDRLMYNQDEGLFVHSPYLISKMAVAHYHLREFGYSQEFFGALVERHPYRLEDLDVYSNILYVQEDKVALSHLAHGAVSVDKYRPESCVIVGNYYSLKSKRDKAVQYFQRALKLNRLYTSAWTLMGHEYVELKNTAAAMEAYRRAVDVNSRDYRAWYGLGQTYEFLDMHLYALFYYRKAAALRPYDARMWCAMGGCYLGLDKREDAIRTYERAVSHNDTEGIATQKLAVLYRQDGHEEKAARCWMRHLELRFKATAQQHHHQEDSAASLSQISMETIINGVVVQAAEAEALLFLAQYHKNHGEYETAAMCCSRLLEYPGPEKEEGKALLREIRSRREADAMEESKDETLSFELSP